jgi:ferredoxin
MTHVVTDNCLECRFTECATVCPVECFHFDEAMVYINPEKCIDCGACVAACPVSAIYDEVVIPANMRRWIELNAARAPRLPVLSTKLEPLPKAAERRKSMGR